MLKYILIAIILFSTSCREKDYDITIYGVEFEAIDNYNSKSRSVEFLNTNIYFAAYFNVDPAVLTNFYRPVGEVTVVNPVDENKMILTSNQDFIVSNDTLKSGENLIHYFDYQKNQQEFHLSYIFRNTAQFLNKTGYYKFYFTAILNDDTQVSDSCLVKINF